MNILQRKEKLKNMNTSQLKDKLFIILNNLWKLNWLQDKPFILVVLTKSVEDILVEDILLEDILMEQLELLDMNIQPPG